MSVNKNVIFKEFNLTPRAKKAFSDAYEKSKDLEDLNINNIHVLYGCIKNMSEELDSFILRSGCLITCNDVTKSISEQRRKNNDKFFKSEKSDPWHNEVVKTIKEANDISTSLDQYYVGIEHILLAMVKVSPYVFEGLDDFVLDLGIFSNHLNSFVKGDADPNMVDGVSYDPEVDSSFEDFAFSEIDSEAIIGSEDQKAPSFAENLNDVCFNDGLQDVYGRDKEVSLLIETISKKNKCNAILTGEAGVGKTAVVEGLVQRICSGDVPVNLLGTEIYNIDIGGMLAGTQYRGQFEQKFKSLLDTVKSNPNMVLFFDEIHTIFGAGGNQEGSIDVANMLKPLLARGEIRCIGATTIAEYEKIFKKDSAMKRRFFNIDIQEPSAEETKEILYNCKSKYEDFHNVRFSKPIIDCVVDFSDKLISNKRFPDKAFDIIDQAGARVKIKNLKPCTEILESHKEFVKFLSKGSDDVQKIKDKFSDLLEDLDEINSPIKEGRVSIKKDDVIEIISEHSNISFDQVKQSNKGFASFLQRMKKEVFGQKETLCKINDLLSCAKVGLTEPDKPLASMFFVGPTSVGKTYTAKKIAKNFFGNEKAIIQINMSELYDKTGISKLIGSNSGYVGYEEGGLLTKFVKNNPNCVVLFDEVEKADPQVLNLLLHLLDEGYIEDNKHEKVDFSRSIVILTSNIGHAQASKKSMGFVQDDIKREDSYKDSVKKSLKPELLARINEVMVFEELEDSVVKKIISFEINKIKNKLLKSSIKMDIKSNSIDCIFNDIKSKNLHARHIKNYIREKIQVPIAKMVVKNSKTSQISIKAIDNRIKLS